jgi:tetratricopeptide (TPR) repeat protein
MKTQQTMKIFIASSSEMHHERIVLSDLFTDMSSDEMIYQPVKWEYVDKAVRTERKEDQYLQRLHDCDVCITMLWKSLGLYTVEEFNDAIKRQKNGENPKKVFVLIKNDKSDVKPELLAFINKLKRQHKDIIRYFSNDSELKSIVGDLLTHDVVVANSVEKSKDAILIKDIYVMVAADGELNEDMMEFADVIAHLNEVLVPRGIRLHRVKWSQGVINEFMQKVNNCEMCLNLYWRDLPENSSEEINRSFRAMLKGDNPRHLYIFFKEPCDEITKALSEFKNSFESEYGHFYCRYENVDTMCLHFILQLMMLKNGLADNMINNESGYVMVGNLPMVNLNKIPFAQYNRDFQRMSERFFGLPKEIGQARELVKTYPENPIFERQLQEKLDKYNELKKEFNQYQKFLFDVAKRITQLQRENMTDRMRRAVKAFNTGDVYRANVILDEAIEDAKNLLENYKMHKVITEGIRKNIFYAIDELMLATATIMADAKQPIEERIEKVKQLYSQADEMANEVNLDKNKHIKLLSEYAMFVTLYCSENVENCKKAIALDERLIEMADNSKGGFELSIADSYERIGTLYNMLREHKQSLINHKKAFTIRKKILGSDNPVTAKYYNNIGVVYMYRARKGDSDKAYINLEKAADIWELDSNTNAALLATAYNNLSTLCMDNDILYVKNGEIIDAVWYAKKSVSMCRKSFGLNHFETAVSYDTLAHALIHSGNAYYKNNGDFYDFCLVNKKALRCLFMALSIELETVGCAQLLTYHTVVSLGNAYLNLLCCQEAIAFLNKALEIDSKIHYLTEYGKEELINSIDKIKSKLQYTVGTKNAVSFSDWEKLANEIDIENEDLDFFNEIL